MVTAIAPVAAALAHAHEQGVVHGDLSPGNIVFTAEGRPVLTDLGVARVLGEAAAGEVTPAYVDPTVARGGAPGPASDVFGVAAAAFHALTGIPPWNAAGPAETLQVAAVGVLPDLAELAPGAPEELLAVVTRGLADDPHERGTAAEFALDLRHACRPEPVRLPAEGIPDEELGRTGRGPRTELTHQVPGRRRAAPPEPEPEPARRWSGALPVLRRAAAVTGIGAVLATAVWLGTRWGSGDDAAPPATAASSSSTPPPAAASPRPVDLRAVPDGAAGWLPVLAELYRRRAEAFGTGGPDALAGVYTAGSAPGAADAAFAASLVGAGEVLRGFAPTVVRVTAATVDGDRAEVELVDEVPGYDVVPAAAPAGPALRSDPGRPAAPVRMVLRATADGWRIESAVLVSW
ncbi:serine/threonine-protein kinase [Geodermatophilus sp. SYSU D00691]